MARPAAAPAADVPPGAPAAAAWVRPAPGRRGLLVDAGYAAVAVLACVLGLELTRAVAGMAAQLPQEVPGRVEDVAWTVLVALPLAVRRRLPLTAMVVSAGAFIGLGERYPASASTFTLNLTLFLVLLSGTAWARDRRRLAGVWVVVLVAMAGWYLLRVVLLPADVPATSSALVGLTALINVLYFAGALLGGRALWRAARDRDALARTAAELRREQGRTARAAVVAERLRIARELHDVVAHHVSTTGVQAAAARRVLERGPADEAALARATGALRQVEGSSRDAVAEMRDLLGVLRDPGEGARAGDGPAPAPERPQPSAQDLPALVEEVRARGLDVRLAVVGTPATLPATTGTTVHRLVQEALANVVRHSAAAGARVVVRWVAADGATPGHVEVEVVDDGPARTGTSGSGLGHRGMAERAALVGGAVETGRRPGGGYRVLARYPLVRAAGPVDRAVGDAAARPGVPA
ncbi:sensor histidine kinase [Pseudokineococcus lusitanus]|uniref:histidine kinase n=1 Tax=Pseudokineococcus lusitanus TaxID=763993 RepID=A0A3N1HMK0_9ACTN|nr:histidine kinase [Pseudokineococcus lusitanus]ROP43757.1 signal transduction histidine kinase [Pseudokineococcus lusitanus]